MSYAAQMGYVYQVKCLFPSFFTHRRVLEVGSLNINGSIRQFFRDCEYTGIDCHAGPDVDVVCLADEFKPEGLFDMVVSCEAFEHDPYLYKSITNIGRILRPGGLFLFTCAGPKRPEHGTRKTTGEAWVYSPDPDYYQNVSKETMKVYCNNLFQPLEMQYGTGAEGVEMSDLYGVGFRK